MTIKKSNKILAALYFLSAICGLTAGVISLCMAFDFYIPSEIGQPIVWIMIAGIVLIQFIIMCYDARPKSE